MMADLMGIRPLGQPKGAENGKGVNFRKGQQQRCPGSIPSAPYPSQISL
jgi:hypothetical protein